MGRGWRFTVFTINLAVLRVSVVKNIVVLGGPWRLGELGVRRRGYAGLLWP